MKEKNYNSKREDLEEEDQGEDERKMKEKNPMLRWSLDY